jgi:hypothetical protein
MGNGSPYNRQAADSYLVGFNFPAQNITDTTAMPHVRATCSIMVSLNWQTPGSLDGDAIKKLLESATGMDSKLRRLVSNVPL